MHIADKHLVATLSEQTDGRPLVAAVYARLRTPASFTRWLGPAGNYLVARPAARALAQRDAERTGVPLDAAMVLGLSEDALHVWRADPLLSRVGDHLGSAPTSRVRAVTTEISRHWWPLTITFGDGEQLQAEARGDVSTFASALAARRP